VHWFIIIFMLVYSGLHALLYLGIRKAFPSGKGWSLGIIAWLILMQLAPIIYRTMEHFGLSQAAAAAARVAYIWMGLVILALLFLGALDLVGLVRKIIPRRKPKPRCVDQSRRKAIATLAAAPALAAYACWESSRVQLRKVVIPTAKLPTGVNKIKIALISDLHLSLMTGSGWLDEVLHGIQKESPDLIISAGDMLDGRMPGMMDLAARLGELTAPLGKYAVLGNHEYYVGMDRSLACHDSAGFELLRGRGITVEGALNIAGVDDARRDFGLAEAAMLKNLPRDLYTVFLRHRPIVNQDAMGLFDLQLSGHTHGGQISPFGLLVRLQFDYLAGGYNLDKGSRIYVSRGTGTWGPPMRLAAPPEVSLVELVPPTSKA
jgi:predicted MPP superfamily phosphohydrolase